jgi:glyoxylase-like metal-dependent hydrolase (beta-lactamase superfamily II)
VAAARRLSFRSSGSDVTEIIRVLAPNPGPFTLEGTNTWIVGPGPTAVIDPGPADEGHLRSVIQEAGRVEAILLTHHHSDHAGSSGALAEATGVPVRAFRPEEGERRVRSGDVVQVGSVRLRVVPAPGHTADHVAYYMESEAALFTGDAVLGRGTSVVDPPDGEMSAYVHSLQTMRGLEPRTLYPGHGPVVFDAAGKLNEYIAHRARRESQVLAALRGGASTYEEMVPAIYSDEGLHPSMFPVAARSVLAHLLKLEKEGRVARTGRSGEGRFVLVEQKPCERCGRPAGAGSRFCRQCGMAVLQEGL